MSQPSAVGICVIRLGPQHVHTDGQPIVDACRHSFYDTLHPLPPNAPLRLELWLGPIDATPITGHYAERVLCPVYPVLAALRAELGQRHAKLQIKSERPLVANTWAALWVREFAE